MAGDPLSKFVDVVIAGTFIAMIVVGGVLAIYQAVAP